ncbi:Uncharacterised protein [Yersinia frederiksenii]|nr:Uncharacterised protein [Yersinia frederiksenii]
MVTQVTLQKIINSQQYDSYHNYINRKIDLT